MSKSKVEVNPSSSNKSLKQARLPFKMLDIKTAFLGAPKKRKNSDGDIKKDLKILKSDSNSENDGNSVNTESRETTVAEEGKQLKNIVIIDLDSEEVNLSNGDSKVKLSNTLTDHSESDNIIDESDSKKWSVSEKDNANCEQNVSGSCNDDPVATKDESISNVPEDIKDDTVDVSKSADATAQDVEDMSCDEVSENPNSTLNSSCVSVSDSDLLKTETSELDRSQIASRKTCESGEENVGPCPPVKKRKVSRTPLSAKQLEEMEKRKQEKLRLRAEKEKQLQESREAKHRAKELEKDRREVERNLAKQQKKRELEEKQAQKQTEVALKLKAKEEEKAKKLETIQAKLEEKKRKDEEKQRKKEEKLKEDEEKLKQEEKRKAESEVSAKSKAAFASFFIKNASSQPTASSEEPCGLFKPFEITKNMVLASITPMDVISLFDKQNLDGCFIKQDSERLYIEELKIGKRCPYKRTKGQLKKDDVDDVIIVDDNNTKGSIHRAKLYQFCENVRPPYYGTWSKTSQAVTSRKPFTKDTKYFDYDVDSEEEWDEGGPGESLSGTEDEKESEDDYEVDNEFFVPHGYLSADEDQNEEEIATDTPEYQARLKMREKEFHEERKQKFSELKPRVVGCIWLSWQSTDSSACPPHQEELCKVLRSYKAVLLTTAPILTSAALPNMDISKAQGEKRGSHRPKPPGSKKVPEEAIPHLIRLVHANTKSRNIILRLFRDFWIQHRIQADTNGDENPIVQLENVVGTVSPISAPCSPVKENSPENMPPSISPKTNSVMNAGFSKRQLDLLLTKIASYGKCPDPNFPRHVWWVHEEVRTKYGCLNLPVPNKWSSISQKKVPNSPSGTPGPNRRKTLLLDSTPVKVLTSDCESSPKVVKPESSILKFTCKMTPAQRFEANLAADAANKKETDALKSASKDAGNSILKFTCKLTTANRFDSNLQGTSKESKTDSKNVADGESKAIGMSDSPKGSPSILKYTRKITPIRLDAPITCKKIIEKVAVNDSKSPTDIATVSSIPDVITLDDTSK